MVVTEMQEKWNSASLLLGIDRELILLPIIWTANLQNHKTDKEVFDGLIILICHLKMYQEQLIDECKKSCCHQVENWEDKCCLLAFHLGGNGED